MLRKWLSWLLLYKIPFNEGSVLGSMTSIQQLNPKGSFVRRLGDIPEEILVVNMRTAEPSHPLFLSSQAAMALASRREGPPSTDGFLTFQDTALAGPNVLEIIPAVSFDHGQIKELSSINNLRRMVEEEYEQLKVILKSSFPCFRPSLTEKDKITLIQAFFKAVILELGYDVDKLEEIDNYTIIDYFMEKDILYKYH